MGQNYEVCMSDNYQNITYKLRLTAFHIYCLRLGKNAETKMYDPSAYSLTI